MSTELEDVKASEDQRALSAKQATRKGFITRAENYILSDFKSVPLSAVKAPDVIAGESIWHTMCIFVLSLLSRRV